MSLIELMVTLGVTSVVSLAAATLFSWTITQFQLAMEKNKSQENLLWASYEIRNYLGQAVNVANVPVVGDCVTSQSNPGCIVSEFNTPAAPAGLAMNTVADTDGSVITLGKFFREAGLGASNMLNTGFYFKKPSAAIDATYNRRGTGVIFLASAAPGVPLVPDTSALFYDNISNLTMTVDSVVDGGGVRHAKSAKITITGRIFNVLDRPNWTFCPGPLDVACGGGAAFADETVTINVNFRNNLLRALSATGDLCGDRLFGCLYFFKTVMPLQAGN